ncbi:MAG: dynamin family protein [Desulfobulbaceae bacterium DB1]|nr:MAG: dynamin family protein [Desulfobulbaceae bacterium DB1]
MDEKKLQAELQQQVRNKLMPFFDRYGLDYGDLDSILKWKPMVLVIGNYSSGKSTLINEILGRELQRTGQAPTDDSFTIITSHGREDGEPVIPGSTLVNDDTLPFARFKSFGEQFISHFRLKKVTLPFLENMAIIDSPGMLDAVTEKDRGYDYLAVLGEFAKLADLVVLMFDPHKAGTISETYTAIRSTLPETSGEDRIVFVMSRIDECDNLSDLVRSYGTLCWNLSQMTGRKDIPRIFVTYAAGEAEPSEILAVWKEEREVLKKKILSAPGFRLNHILQDIDRQANELLLISEAMDSFGRRGRTILYGQIKLAALAAGAAFFLTDSISKAVTGVPDEPLLIAVMNGTVAAQHFLFPLTGVAVICFLTWLWFSRWSFPRLVKSSLANMNDLVVLDTSYKKSLWLKVGKKAASLLSRAGLGELGAGHRRNLNKIRKFIHRDLQEYYNKIR